MYSKWCVKVKCVWPTGKNNSYYISEGDLQGFSNIANARDVSQFASNEEQKTRECDDFWLDSESPAARSSNWLNVTSASRLDNIRLKRMPIAIWFYTIVCFAIYYRNGARITALSIVDDDSTQKVMMRIHWNCYPYKFASKPYLWTQIDLCGAHFVTMFLARFNKHRPDYVVLMFQTSRAGL